MRTDLPGTSRLLLEGGAEFGGAMAEADLRALERAGGFDAPIAVLPTAAAPHNNHKRPGANAVRWFHSLGATRVESLAVVDRVSANDASQAPRVRQARLIYMPGGFPGYLAETLKGSFLWQAAAQARAGGAVLGGSSAGAMTLCSRLYDPQAGAVVAGLNLLPGCCILPITTHLAAAGRRRSARPCPVQRKSAWTSAPASSRTRGISGPSSAGARSRSIETAFRGRLIEARPSH